MKLEVGIMGRINMQGLGYVFGGCRDGSGKGRNKAQRAQKVRQLCAVAYASYEGGFEEEEEEEEEERVVLNARLTRRATLTNPI